MFKLLLHALMLAVGLAISAVRVRPVVLSRHYQLLVTLDDFGIYTMKVNIGSPFSYLNTNYIAPNIKNFAASLPQVKDLSRFRVRRFDGKTVQLKTVSTQSEFGIDTTLGPRRFPLCFTDADYPDFPYSHELGLGVQSRGMMKGEPAHQRMDFALFNRERFPMILFAEDIKSYMNDLAEDCVLGWLPKPRQTSPLSKNSSKFALKGIVNAGIKFSQELDIAFETIHNYVELPSDVFTVFVAELEQSGRLAHRNGVYHLRDCSSRSNYVKKHSLPNLTYDFEGIHISMGPRSYLGSSKDNSCPLLVRAQANPQYLVVGIPLLKNAVFAVTRGNGTDLPTIYLCQHK